MASSDEDTVLLQCSESILTCQICMERFESPRILPCQHTFCKLCVLSLIKKHCVDDANGIVKSEFPCPNCRKNCKIRSKTFEEAKLLKAFSENLLIKELLEAAEVDTDQSRRSRGEKISLEFPTAEKIRDALYRYQNILIAIQHLLQTWPSRKPRVCDPMRFCTDIREQLSSFMLELTDAADIEKFPKVGHGDRNIKAVLSRVSEEERYLGNTYRVDTLYSMAREVAETPCCLDYIELVPIMTALRRAGAHGHRAGMPDFGHGMPRSPEERGGTSHERPASDARDGRQHGPQVIDQTEVETRAFKCMRMFGLLCVTVMVLFIAASWSM